MRRELKARGEELWSRKPRVSAVVPMRRELKVQIWTNSIVSCQGFSSCPDEEGTESARSCIVRSRSLSVSAVVPMRRELKVFGTTSYHHPWSWFQQLSR